MAIAHVLKPAPAQGAAQLFLLFSDAGQPWQGMRPLGEKLAAAFASGVAGSLAGAAPPLRASHPPRRPAPFALLGVVPRLLSLIPLIEAL